MIMPILAVEDVDASVSFYTQKLGFNHDFSLPGPDGQNAFAGVTLGKASFGLSRAKDLEHRGNGVAFMVYVTDETDLDGYYADVQARGTLIAEPIKTQYWGDRSFEVRDPDGYVLSLSKTVKQVDRAELEAGMRGELQPA
jgi:PhnB protein